MVQIPVVNSQLHIIAHIMEGVVYPLGQTVHHTFLTESDWQLCVQSQTDSFVFPT